jgi:hypothetical protein
MVELSAKEGTNIDTLLEMLLLVSELQELKANPKRSAAGVVLEAKMEKGRGTVATLLVQNGTLSVGDNFIAGSSFGKIRAMFTDQGESISEAEPSTAVEILGFPWPETHSRSWKARPRLGRWLNSDRKNIDRKNWNPDLRKSAAWKISTNKSRPVKSRNCQ